MIVTIDFDRKEIDYPESVRLGELAETLVEYFQGDKWKDFKVVIHEGIDTNGDIER